VALCRDAFGSCAGRREQSYATCRALEHAARGTPVRAVADSDLGSGIHTASTGADHASSVHSACSSRFANRYADRNCTSFAFTVEHTTSAR